MAGHTPGPWSHDVDEPEPLDDITITAPDPSGVHIATVTACWPCADMTDEAMAAEAAANARLIAAAPKLLAACVAAHTRMLNAYAVRVKVTGVTGGKMLDEINELAAAIAEATGTPAPEVPRG
jgi:hypothetical protein